MEVEKKQNVKQKPPVFYNYEPINKNLKVFCTPAPDTKAIEETINQEFQLEIENALKGNVLDQIDAKDINADLKRDLKKKLDILSKKTEASVFELIKRKLKNSSQGTKLEDINDKPSKNTTKGTLHVNDVGNENLGHILRKALNKLEFLDESE